MGSLRNVLALSFAVSFLGFGCGNAGNRVAGEACGFDNQCEGGVCIPESLNGEFTGWPGGLCTSPCLDGACPDGQVCQSLDGWLYCLPGCTESADCRADYVCNADAGACYPDCRVSLNCPEGLRCGEDGACTATLEDAALIGSTCAADYQCASGICFEARDTQAGYAWYGGMCVEPAKAAGCPEGSTGVKLDEGVYCLPDCNQTLPCRDHFVCSEDAGVCLPDCRSGFVCGEDYACSKEGDCRYDWPELNPLGSPCDGVEQCQSGWCLGGMDPAPDPAWSGGMCSHPCLAPGDCEASFGCLPMQGQGFCLPQCTPGSSSCRSGYVCDPDVRLCLPNCNKGWNCGPYLECGPDGVCHHKGPMPGR